MLGCAFDAWRLSRKAPSERAWRTDARMMRIAVGGHTIRVLDSGGSGAAVLFGAHAPVVLEHYARVSTGASFEHRCSDRR